ncbi:MAG: hypothetical protein EOO77_25065 [Oxalobacteraceae bacterium]|nr:MAG: hypothetical protein EOO77_25065 [Oxalobacteraceae bacterium]
MHVPAPAILLDLDGTLIDSQPGILSSCRTALRALGHVPGPMQNLSAVIGPPMDDVMRFLLAPYPNECYIEGVLHRHAHTAEGQCHMLCRCIDFCLIGDYHATWMPLRPIINPIPPYCQYGSPRA